jgi:hypothetical protein
MRKGNEKLSRISLDRQAGVKHHSIPKCDRCRHRGSPQQEPTMNARTAIELPSSLPAATLPGTWKLAGGRAVTLRPPTDGILRIAHGRVWATREGPHGATPDESGDHVLGVGRSMYIRAGERVVIEGWTRGGASYFGWEPVARSVAAGARVRLAVLRQPLTDLRLACALALRASGALVHGVAMVVRDLVGGTSRRPCGNCTA